LKYDPNLVIMDSQNVTGDADAEQDAYLAVNWGNRERINQAEDHGHKGSNADKGVNLPDGTSAQGRRVCGEGAKTGRQY
jgi:hypothetical protein